MKLIDKNGILKMYCDTCDKQFTADYHNIMMVWNYDGQARFIHNVPECDNNREYPFSRHFEQWIEEVQKRELAGRKRRQKKLDFQRRILKDKV